MDVRHSFLRRGAGRGRALVALTAGALIAGGIAVLAAASPAAAAGDVTVISIEGGKSALTAYAYDADGLQTASQLLNTSKNCYQSSVDGTVLTAAAANPATSKVGIYGLSMGVTDSTTSNGAACAQVNTGSTNEAIRLALKTGSTGALFAVLDVEVQKNVIITAIAKSGATTVGTFTLKSGDAATGAGAGVTLCNKGATSSGSNNSATDNCRWTIYPTGRFDSLELSASKLLNAQDAQFSIEGGTDYGNGAGSAKSGILPTYASYFFLGEGCTPNNSTVTLASGSGKVVSASYVPDGVNIDGSPCIDTDGKSFTTDGTTLTLNNPNASAFEQGTVTATWTASPGTPARSSTDVNFVPNKPDAYWVTMPWCPATLFDSNGDRKSLTGISSEPAVAATQLSALGLVDQDFATSANNPLTNNNRFQYACVESRTTVFVPGPTPTFQTQDTLYLIGDVVWRG